MGDHDDLVSALIESNRMQQVHITDLLSIMSKQQTTVQSLLPATATSPQHGIRIPEKKSTPTFMQSHTQLEPRGKDAQNATSDFRAPAAQPYFPSLGQRIEKEGEEIREQSIDEIFEEAQKESEAKDKRIKDLEEFVAELGIEARTKNNTHNIVEKHVGTLLKLDGDLIDELYKLEAELKEKDMMIKKMEERNEGLLAQIGCMEESKSLGVPRSAWPKTEDEGEGDLRAELEQLKREFQTVDANCEQQPGGEEQHDNNLDPQHEPTDDDFEDTQGMAEHSDGGSVGNSDESAGLLFALRHPPRDQQA